MSKNSIFSNLKNDFPAGMVVFLVAVPLCLGIALASGAPLFSGIIAGIVGGTVVAFLSKSHIGVSGPAAGLAVIVADAIVQLGTNPEGDFNMERGFSLFLSAVVIGGVIQIILAFCRAGIIGYYFPNSVVKGMLSGIGIIIILKQIPHALGHDIIPDGLWAFFQPDGENTFSEIVVAIGDINPAAVIITIVSMAILILWEQQFIKNIKVFQILQGPLVVVLVGILLSRVFMGMEGYDLAQDEMVNIPLPSENANGFIGLFSPPDWSRVFTWEILVIAFTIAIVASLETLLCVEATDKLDPEKYVTPTNRELLAQGSGNIVSGLIGGLPITQVIVRSSANIQSGGKTKMAAIIHGFMLLFSAMLIPDILNMIPLSSLAAILFLVGYKLATPALFKDMYRRGMAQFVPFVVTIVGIVFTDLLMGIGIGLAVAIFLILYKNYTTPFSIEPEADGKPMTLQLSENVTFLNKAGILKTLYIIPENSKVIIDCTRSKYIHPDVVEILENYKVHAENNNIDLQIIGTFDEDKENVVLSVKKKLRKDEEEKKSYVKSVLDS